MINSALLLRGWACFDEDFYYEDDMEDVVINTQTVVKEFKTGGNAPCPCGKCVYIVGGIPTW